MNDEQIRLMLEGDFAATDYEDKNDSEAEDYVVNREENTDTEQEGDSEEETEDRSTYYLGKDSQTKWNKTAPSAMGRKHARNIVTEPAGVKGEAKYLKEAGDIWKLFFSHAVIHKIVQHTNEQLLFLRPLFSRERDCAPTDEVEIQAFLGLLIFAGVRKNSRLNARDFFKTDGSAPELYRLVMSQNRFYLLMRCLRFDDKRTRPERAAIDKLAPIREIFDKIVSKFKKYYSVSQYVTIDEKLEAFRGRCGFRQYIPSKPNKYGINIYALTDAKAFYTLHLEVYVGRQFEGPYFVDNSSLALVLRLCEVIRNTGRNVTCDNFFTSLPLLDTLEKDYKLTLLGTISKNKRELPKEFTDVKRREENSSLFGHRGNCALVSYVPKKNKNVLLLSSLHDDEKINMETTKPEIIMDYNATKEGVDTVDKMCETYNVARGTNRWPMVVFYSLMNVAGINSYIIYTQNNPDKKLERRLFLDKLAYELVDAQLRRRAGSTNLPRIIRQRCTEICKLDGPASAGQSSDIIQGRCTFCSSRKNRKTRYNCITCKNFFCLEHAVMVCSDCYTNTS